jgi:protein-L-isoaspartate(D-aspartate) O-methyltransferase
MVETQIELRGVTDRRVVDAMAKVPREEFVTPGWREAAYCDGALPIECGQTISQPFTVALMCEAARISEADKVLEIGTGSGYGAAVLSLLAQEVHTVERIPTLAHMASDRLKRLGYSNVHVHQCDGTLGLPSEAPFDAIIVTAGADALPKPFLDQLRDGGRIIIPLGSFRSSQSMYRFTLANEKLYMDNLGGFAFVPLIGAHGWNQ